VHPHPSQPIPRDVGEPSTPPPPTPGGQDIAQSATRLRSHRISLESDRTQWRHARAATAVIGFGGVIGRGCRGGFSGTLRIGGLEPAVDPLLRAISATLTRFVPVQWPMRRAGPVARSRSSPSSSASRFGDTLAAGLLSGFGLGHRRQTTVTNILAVVDLGGRFSVEEDKKTGSPPLIGMQWGVASTGQISAPPVHKKNKRESPEWNILNVNAEDPEPPEPQPIPRRTRRRPLWPLPRIRQVTLQRLRAALAHGGSKRDRRHRKSAISTRSPAVEEAGTWATAFRPSRSISLPGATPGTSLRWESLASLFRDVPKDMCTGCHPRYSAGCRPTAS